MGYEPLTKYIVITVVALQLTIAFLLRHTHPLSWKFIVAAYVIGGTANHNLFLAIHEVTHNLAFKDLKANKMLSILANLPIGVPYSISFKVNEASVLIVQVLLTEVSGLIGLSFGTS
jgi:sphingolipid delta-4 desaturase